MRSDLAIQTQALSKRYRLGSMRPMHRSLRESITEGLSRWRRTRATPTKASESEFWALRGVDIEIAQGQTLGVIGHNGAGKSTLLKILSRITDPTEGRVALRGRVGSLLEVGTGFHPELTGRENIFLNGAILGMTRAEVKSRFDEIVEFSGVEKFLETPVKRYSSGMYVRLAFAVAAHLEPEVLIVDEVLAVGDAAFQKKCLGRMRDVANHGRTVLFVSHNMAAVEALCDTAVHLDHGKVVQVGKPTDVIAGYLRGDESTRKTPLAERTDRKGTGVLRFTELTVQGPSTQHDIVRCGDEVKLQARYRCPHGPVKHALITMVIYTASGQCVTMLNNEMTGSDFETLPSEGVVQCRIPRLGLAPGGYTINVFCKVNHEIADWVQQAGEFTVEAGDFFGTGRLPPATHGGVLTPQEWRIAA
ncbi:MAG: ATP-binding cassette domain-containing protein [Phycisphaera sp.]|nr:ATP-binding cassette domain-containing protein [Phycisphaera sp.]